MTTPSTNISLFNSSNFNRPTSEENTDKITSNLRSINANQQAIIANVSSISANSASVTAEVLRAQAAESTLTTNLNAEILRAQGAESSNASAISAEEIRAQGAESTLTTNLNAEILRAQGAESSNASAISAEEIRAQGAESTLTTNVTALQSSDATNTSAIATLQSANTSNQSAIATLQSANTSNQSAIATLQSSNASNASAISTEESRAQGAENTLTTNVTALQTANTTNTSAISTLESMIGTWDYATYGTLATYVLTLQSGGGGGGTSYTTYNVKVVTNVLNQNVYSIQAPSSNFYTQPVLSFGAGDQFLFDIQDATYSAANAALVFGTTVDIAGTINTAVVSTVNNNILLTIDSAYSGSNLVYFDSGTANMGYVAPPSGTTYTVTVANGVYSFASGGSTVTPTFTNGTTYIFDLADVTNAGQQFVLGSTLDDTSTLFSTQTIMGTPGQTGAYVSYTIPNFNAVAYFSYTTTGMGATISQADYEYIVKTVTNVTGDVVYAFDTNGDGTFYNQPDLTFAVGSKYLFQTSQIASGYTLSFGTTVDGTPDTSVVTSGTNQLLLDLSAKTGAHYTYFDSTNTGMGYVEASPANTVTVDLSNWTQLGSDIDGSTGDEINSCSLSADGYTVVFGSKIGQYVRVYRYSSGSWTQLGSTITDSGSGTTEFGWNVSISADGNTFIVGASESAGDNNDGQFASVYRYNSTNGWVLSQKFTGTRAFGHGVDITPDGNTVVISACPYQLGTSGIFYAEIHTYDTSTSTWSQKGSDIVDSRDSGYSVSISSDGNTFALGGGYHYAKVYRYANSSWSQLGSTITESGVSYMSTNLALSADGNTVACHAYTNQNIYVYEYTTDWNKISTISNTTSVFLRRFHFSNDASTIITSSKVGDYVQVLEYTNNSWTQVGTNINAEVSGDQIGFSCALSADAKQFAVTAPRNDGGGNNSGHVRVYTIESESQQATSPYVVTVANGVFNIDGVAQPTLTFTSGNTYAFDQSDSSNAGHPLVIGTTADDNTTLVTQTLVGTPGQAGAYTQFTATATTVYYFCYNHSGMGA